jgi:hypothetical protein
MPTTEELISQLESEQSDRKKSSALSSEELIRQVEELSPESVGRMKKGISVALNTINSPAFRVASEVAQEKSKTESLIASLENQPAKTSEALISELETENQGIWESAANAAMKGIAKGVGEVARGFAASTYGNFPTSGMGGSIGIPNSALAEYNRSQNMSPSEKMRVIQEDVAYKFGSKIIAGAEQRWPVSNQNRERIPVQVAEAAAGFVVPVATGPMAPLTMGLQSAGMHISDDFESLKKSGKSEDDAAERAMKNAMASGALQSTVFAALPKPLRKVGEKLIIEKIGGEGFKRWLAGRTSTAAEGAVLGAASGGGESVIAEQPIIPAAAKGAVGMAAMNLVMPRLSKTERKTGEESIVEEPRQSVSENSVTATRSASPISGYGWKIEGQSEIPQGPGAKTASAAAGSQSSESYAATALKNAVADVERKTLGMPEATPAEKRAMEYSWSKAGEAISADPMAGEKATAKMVADPTAGLTDVDSALVLRNKVELQNRINDSVERQNTAKTPEEKSQAKADAEKYSNQLLDLMDAAKARGTEWGREGRWRRAMAYEDFTFASQEQLMRAKKGVAPLTEVERTNLQATVDEYKVKYDELNKRQAERQNAAVQEAVSSAMAEVSKRTPEPLPYEPRVLKYAESFAQFMDKQAEAALKRLNQKMGRTTAGLDPTILSDVVIIGAAKITRGTVNFAKWSDAMIRDVGDWIKPHLQEAFTASQKTFEESLNRRFKNESEPVRRNVKRVIAKADVGERLDAIKDQMEAAVSKGDQTALHPLAKKLARAIIERDNLGEKDVDRLIKTLHEEMQPLVPELTPEGARDAFSGIGNYKMPSTDKVSAALADLKQQALLLGQAERIETRKPVPPTGLQRQPMSDTARRILQRVQELKRKFGINVASPEVQLRSALQSRERWYEHRIADLRAEIKSGMRAHKNQPTQLTSVKLKTLRDEYEQVVAEHASIFKKPGLTDDQRLKLVLAGAERSEKAWSQRLENAKKGNFNPLAKTNKPVSSPELQAIQSRTDAIRQEVEMLRKMAFPPKTQEQLRLQSALAGAERSLELWNKRVADAEKGNYGSSPLKPKISSKELDALKAQRDAAKTEFERLKKSDFPPQSPEDIALDMLKTRLTQRIADLHEKIAKGDFESKPSKEPPADKDTIRLRAELEGVKEKFKHLRDKAEWNEMSVFQKVKRSTIDTYDASRMIMTTGEFSFILRQGKWAALSHPIQSIRAMHSMFQAMRSPQRAREVNLAILDHPEYRAAKAAKLHIVEEGASLTRQEEIYMGHWAHAIPVVSGFNRAATAYLNKVRFDNWLAMRKSMTRKGGPTALEDAAIAQFVNESTGRGTLGKFEPAAVFLGRTMFAPRYFWSRVQLLAGHSMWAGTGRTRVAIAKEYARSLIGLWLYYGMLGMGAKALGKSVSLETDPRSSDFGKVKIGDTRLDPLAGLAQVITFVGRTISGQTKTLKGEIRSLRAAPDAPTRYGQDDWYDVAARFARTKMHPVPGNIANLFSGTEMDGSPASLGRSVGHMVSPITYFDVYDALLKNDLPTGTALSLLTILGEGLQTYNKQQNKTQGPLTMQEFMKGRR